MLTGNRLLIIRLNVEIAMKKELTGPLMEKKIVTNLHNLVNGQICVQFLLGCVDIVTMYTYTTINSIDLGWCGLLEHFYDSSLFVELSEWQKYILRWSITNYSGNRSNCSP